MTHKYRVQLEKEEELWLSGEIQRDKSGLLPIEAKAASERGSLGMADLRTALEVGDCGLGSMPLTIHKIMFDYREGEVDGWEDYSLLQTIDKAVASLPDGPDTVMSGMNGGYSNVINGINGPTVSNGINGHQDDEDADGYGWEGTAYMDRQNLNSLLDSVLAIGS